MHGESLSCLSNILEVNELSRCFKTNGTQELFAAIRVGVADVARGSHDSGYSRKLVRGTQLLF